MNRQYNHLIDEVI